MLGSVFASTSIRQQWVVALVTACITAAVAVGIARHYELGPVDDAFISLRYAANWAGGEGLCFNPGEVVEGFTNFLLVLLIAATIRCGAEPVLAMTVIGWVTLALLSGVFARFAIRHVFPQRPLLSVTVAVVAVLNPVLVCWASSGLESCLYALLLMAGVTVLLDRASSNHVWLSAFLLVLAGMTRPETVALVPAVLVVNYWVHRSGRRVVGYAGMFLVGYGVYFAVRAWHFGYLFPNTFYAKLDYGSARLLQHGVIYVYDFLCASALLFLPALAALLRIDRAPVWVKAFALIIAGQLLIVIYEGGDHFAMYRFMVPVLPFLLAVALYPCTLISRRIKHPRGSTAVLALVSIAVLAASNLWIGRQIKRDKEPQWTQFQWHRYEVDLAGQWSRLGRWFRRNVPSGSSLVNTSIGALGYYSGLTIVDPLGIVDPVIAHQRRALGRGYRGHEKHDCAYVLSQRPDYILLVDVATPSPIPEPALAGAVWGEFNLRLAGDPQLAQQYRYESVAVGRYFLNIHVRRDLPRLQPGGG